MAARPAMTPGEEHVAFYMAIGIAITQWSHIEHALYGIAAIAFPEKGQGALGPGYFSIENFRSKLAFVDRAFPFAEGANKFAVEWAGIREDVRSLSSRRNELAHSRVNIYPNCKPGRRYAIVPLFAKESKRKTRSPQPPAGSLCVRDIDLIQQRFSRVAVRLWSLRYQMRGVKDPFAEPAQQEPQPRTLAEIRRQIDAILQPPAQSSREKSQWDVAGLPPP